ncbi:cytochrome P450 306a1 [Anopheles darlingi]|uniref:cytochrome P450 306a1 n=1 Tax=Anopheles darlingi TaxID=43151 RepID=UPI0021002525|nr:cytochrome P450 306a1 [Anopheles darlingi]XP_049538382.1 cytochrome P450 306a1 [Anopheles darlingi]XP_049538383.1 cytochrome P450 306a1 [Anopheles darlingi]XP_049538384.1 cytochrome P450 306a1 [Anopheles darlingi]
MIWTWCIGFAVLYIVVKFWVQRDQPPGPVGIPLVGYLPFIDAKKPYETFTQLSKKYGPIYGLRMGQVYAVVLSNYSLIRTVLAKDESTGRAPLYITHGIMGGYGLICAQGALWRDQRKLSIEWLRQLGMTKFKCTRDSLEKKISSSLNEMIEDIAANTSVGVGGFDPSATIHHVLGNLMNDLVFGLKYEKQDETWQFLQHLQEEGVKHIGVSMAVNFLPWLRYFPSTRRTIQFLLDGKTKTHTIYDAIIAEKRQNLQSSATSDTNSECILKSFLEESMNRINAGRVDASHCSDVQLRHLMADLFGAGVDTTFTTIRWALLYIALYPTVQFQLRQELEQALTTNKAPTLDDIELLPYLRATIAEVQRIRTVVPVGIPHGTTKEMMIAGFRIPANTMIMPLLWAVHMDPDNFPDPEKFKPERFLDKDGKFSVPHCFLPFQSGKRMCLGDELARYILHLYVANLLFCCERFDIVQEDACVIDMTGTCGITLTPPTYRMMFHKVKHSREHF